MVRGVGRRAQRATREHTKMKAFVSLLDGTGVGLPVELELRVRKGGATCNPGLAMTPALTPERTRMREKPEKTC